MASIKKFKKINWIAGNPIDFSMGEFELLVSWFKLGLKDLMQQIPKSGRIEIKLICKRSK